LPEEKSKNAQKKKINKNKNSSENERMQRNQINLRYVVARQDLRVKG